MKVSILFVLLTFTMSAFAGNSFNFRVSKVECSGVPNWIQFDIQSVDTQGNYKGSGMENYLRFDLNCKMSADKEKIICSSPQNIATAIVIDSNSIVTASFTGEYHSIIKIGCVARM